MDNLGGVGPAWSIVVGGWIWTPSSVSCMSRREDPRGGIAWVGTRWGLRRGREERPSKRGMTLWEISSMGRCLHIFLCGVFHMRGHLAGLSLTRREWWHRGDLKVDLLGQTCAAGPQLD